MMNPDYADTTQLSAWGNQIKGTSLFWTSLLAKRSVFARALEVPIAEHVLKILLPHGIGGLDEQLSDGT